MRFIALLLVLLVASPILAEEPKAHRDVAYADTKNERQTLDVYAPSESKGYPTFPTGRCFLPADIR